MGFVPLVVGAVLALIILVAVSAGPQRDAEDLALGADTSSLYGSKDGVRIHCGDLWPDPPRRQADVCLDGAIARDASAYALWLGNSQVHGVNRLQDGDQTAAQILFDSLGGRGLDLVTLSQPNANLQEHYVLFEYVRDRLPLRLLVLPVVFDDTREEGVRNRLHAAFRRPGVRRALAETEIGSDLLVRFGSDLSDAAPGATEGATPGATDADLAALDETVQDVSETWLNDQLAEHSALWASRPGLRAGVFSFLYLARNSALGITPSTVRPLQPGPYARNMAALEATLQRAQEGDVHVLVYVAPLRNDVNIPYIPEEYRRFKREAEALAEQYDASFADVEGVVPGPLWGMKPSTNLSGEPEYDFMHFQADGHARLADALLRELDAQTLPLKVDP